MYAPIKDKVVPPSPTRYTTYYTRVVPRYIKAYIWLCFLILVFGYMLLLDNGISPLDLLPGLTSADLTTSSPAQLLTQIQDDRSDSSEEPPVHIPPIVPVTHTVSSEELRNLIFGSGVNAFTPDDVVILFKTGATSLWHRVPIHLSTTLSNNTLTPNVVLYSDQADHIAGRPIIDVLANISSPLKASSDFELYRNLKTLPSQHLYLESATMDGDQYLPGGWRLDKYKFLPLMSHAALAHPGKKWYIYMEDDNYFFWHSLYNWLSTFDPSTPLFLGGPAARLGEDFAHGGSGFIVSGAAMAKTFGAHPSLAHDWESYAQQRCCGDQVVSHVMAVNGVPRDRRHDHTGWAGLQALPHWLMAFGHWNWCSPLFNVHKVHQADVSNLHILEKAFQARHGESQIMTWGDLFELTIAPTLLDADGDETDTDDLRKLEWDNNASEQWHRSTEADQSLSQAEKEQQPWFSADACQAACRAWFLCLSWKYADDACGLSSTVVAGRPVKEGIALTSGYLVDRIGVLRTKSCPALGYGLDTTSKEK